MNRREFLVASGAGGAVGASGCIDGGRGIERSDPNGTEPADDADEVETIPTEEGLEVTCSHVPADADRLEYAAEEYRFSSPFEPILADARESDDASPLALVTTREGAETRLKPGRTDVSPCVADGVRSFADGTDFDEQVLLVWQRTLTVTGLTTDVVGVTRPDAETVRAYLCEYGTGGTAPQQDLYLLRVDVSYPPDRAEVAYRVGTPRHSEGRVDTREETYVSE